ncbi:MAG: hypothetical protein KFF73_11175 [Cyclobacteriaceae bacterium]|nr:hypothetical protein [Cyclobacteriaceae bacterium]
MGNFFVHIQPVLKKLALVTFVLMLIFFTSFITVFAQCPEINPDDIEISVDQLSRQINIQSLSDLNFRSMDLSLYNMDNGAYYFDSERKKEVVDLRGLSVNIRSNDIEIKNIIPGDFVIIIDNPGCEKQVIGWGYSGLPHSGIRIQE